MWKFLFLCTLATSLLSAAEEQEPAKKHKAHFVGVRRSAHKPSPKKSTSRKNPWVKTTTYPKKKEKQAPATEEETLSDDIPYFNPSGNPL
jgi:hypothetical protein